MSQKYFRMCIPCLKVEASTLRLLWNSVRWIAGKMDYQFLVNEGFLCDSMSLTAAMLRYILKGIPIIRQWNTTWRLLFSEMWQCFVQSKSQKFHRNLLPPIQETQYKWMFWKSRHLWRFHSNISETVMVWQWDLCVMKS